MGRLTPGEKPEPGIGEPPRVIGEPFNPWRKSCGFYPADIVGRQRFLLGKADKPKDGADKLKDVTDGQKRLYDRLVRYAGQNGYCWPSHETLADDLGKSPRQIKRDIAALESLKLLGDKVRHARRWNTYEFLWHSIFEVTSTAPQITGAEEFEGTPTAPQTISRGDIQGKVKCHPGQFEGTSTPFEGTPTAHKLIRNSSGNNSENSSSVSPEPKALVEEHAEPVPESDDDVFLREELSDTLKDLFADQTAPSGKPPVDEVWNLLKAAGLGPRELLQFALEYQGRITGRPVFSWKHVVSSLGRFIADRDTEREP
ncbi:MAG: helix-turn-helix domain-containing protein, partial [Acidobacteria bacterium]|nr:helix-turn-helix domain-containing protein [Acidobacteriota bacterium]